MPLLSRLLLPAIFILHAASAAAAAETPQQLLGQMRAAYAALRSYSDTGVVLTHMPRNDLPNETTFRSVFARPGLFRFEWTSHHAYPPLRHIKFNSVIWSNGDGAYFWSDWGGNGETLEKQDSLEMAVAAATGVSHGAAHTIASLLLPPMGRTIGEGVTWDGKTTVEDVEGVACHHFTGQHKGLGHFELWVGKDDYLVRKVTSRRAGILSEEIRRNIQLNVEIPERTFASEK